jgi:signal transduction histidine kinase
VQAIRLALKDVATYRRLLYLLSALPLGLVWFVSLLVVWSLCLGLAITPFVLPLALILGAITRAFAAVEAEIARSLLGVDARAPGSPSRGLGFWRSVRATFGRGFWQAQAYLLIRWLTGITISAVLLSLLAAALGMIFAPIWLPLVHGGWDLGFWRPRTFAQSLGLVPLGVILLPATVLTANPLASPFGPIATELLPGHGPMEGLSRTPAATGRHGFQVHAATGGVVVFALILIWAVTSRGYFWPIWIALVLGLTVLIRGWLVLLAEHESLVRRFRRSRTLAGTVGVGAAVELFFIAVWAITGHSYFWPIWPFVAIAVIVAAQTVAGLISAPGQAEMAERIETLESSRAGAVDVQETELRRIERDLHDGAQARLVALGMNLGMAEQKLHEDPSRAGELLAEARAGAEQALRELRDLARGIHPPILADRGLEPAIAALASSAPMRVRLSVDVAQRPSSRIESAAYFVVAEALANAAKHAHADCLEIRVLRTDGALELEVKDDGVGSADPGGSGLRGLQRRVEALDGTFVVTSPPGGPTTIRAELPCAS